MAQDVARAMSYLHDFKPAVIHRDLKSLNLLLTSLIQDIRQVPVVKVSDFGLAKMQDGEQSWGKMTVEAGTFHWMAPEVASGHYNQKADVYSFSMVLFELICREIPFEDLEPNDVLKLTKEGHRPDPEAVPPNTPQELEALMHACWKHNPEERPDFHYVCKELDACVTKHNLQM